jgi:hypothetical protein
MLRLSMEPLSAEYSASLSAFRNPNYLSGVPGVTAGGAASA